MMAQTKLLPYNREAIAEAARLIGEGFPVAVPTETVYGLAADATRGEAVARISTSAFTITAASTFICGRAPWRSTRLTGS